MMKAIIFLFFVFFGVRQAEAACTLALTINEAISASTSDYLQRAQSRAIENNCDSIFLRINTPGGSLQSTRLIVERILASPIPFLCLVAPSGGHAGSAGAIILQACHVNGGLKATNIGAATPVLGTGNEMPEDLRKKMINDTVSWLAGVTKLRGRNLKFSEEIVTEAKALSSEEAVKENALDILALSESDFLFKSEGRKVLVAEQKEVSVSVGELHDFLPDIRYRVLSFVADPEFAYLLFMGSLGLLYVEMTHPGLIAPGVVGGMGLVLSLIAFHKLDVAWGGLALIILGIAFLILEIFVPSFGILGIGGLISLFVGSVFLFDAEVTGYTLPLSLIAAVVGIIAVFVLGIGYLALKTVKMKSKGVDEDLAEADGVVISVDESGRHGQVEIMGEVWSFTSADSEELKVQDVVQVTTRMALMLYVKKKVE